MSANAEWVAGCAFVKEVYTKAKASLQVRDAVHVLQELSGPKQIEECQQLLDVKKVIPGALLAAISTAAKANKPRHGFLKRKADN